MQVIYPYFHDYDMLTIPAAVDEQQPEKYCQYGQNKLYIHGKMKNIIRYQNSKVTNHFQIEVYSKELEVKAKDKLGNIKHQALLKC